MPKGTLAKEVAVLMAAVANLTTKIEKLEKEVHELKSKDNIANR